MNVENQGSNMLIFFNTRSRNSRKMFVISISVDPENPAERFDRMLKTELMDSI